VHLLLEEFKISVQSFLSTQSLCHTVSPRVRVWSHQFSNPGVRQKKRGLRASLVEIYASAAKSVFGLAMIF